jgi:hypothetical protein
MELLKCGAGEDQLGRSCEKWRIQRVEEETDILHTTKWRKATQICHIYCRHRLPKHVSERKIEGMGRQRRWHKQLMNNLKDTKRHWKLKEELLHLTLWRTCFGIGCVPAIRKYYMMIHIHFHLSDFWYFYILQHVWWHLHTCECVKNWRMNRRLLKTIYMHWTCSFNSVRIHEGNGLHVMAIKKINIICTLGIVHNGMSLA